jgi:uncharacterized protein YciI
MRRILMIALAVALVPLGAAAAQPAAASAEAPRQLFLFLFRPGPAWREGVPMRQQDLRAHAAYHAQLLREGRSFAGGGYVGMDGGLAIVRAADRAEAEAMLAADPAILNGVFAAEIRQWAPRFHGPGALVEAGR